MAIRPRYLPMVVAEQPRWRASARLLASGLRKIICNLDRSFNMIDPFHKNET